jgi:hypothetical protein
MDLITFKSSLHGSQPPSDISPCLTALWYDAKDWVQAHNIAQDIDDQDGSWVHGYLHRKEGDPGNARYWYNRAGRPMPDYALEREWEEIVTYFLSRSDAS